MSLGHHVRDLVHGAGNEVHELKFSHRAHAGKRSAKSRAHNRRLSNRSINHPLSAKAVNKSICDFECATVDSNVLTKTEDGRIALHLLPNALTNSFEICKLGHKLSI